MKWQLRLVALGVMGMSALVVLLAFVGGFHAALLLVLLALAAVAFEFVLARFARAEENRRRAEQQAERYLNAVGTLILVLDTRGRVTRVNPHALSVLGEDEGALLGSSWIERSGVAEADEIRSELEALLRGRVRGPLRYESEIAAPANGDQLVTRQVAWSITALLEGEGAASALLVSGEDVTEERRAQEAVSFLAYHDALTHLPNRAFLESSLGRTLAAARRSGGVAALFYADLDGFKLVNDAFGGAAGDQLLRQVARRLEREASAADVIARQSGDEFLLLVPDLRVDADDEAAARASAWGIARRLREAVATEPYQVEGELPRVDVSVGFALFPFDARDSEGLMRLADDAMYEEKKIGKEAHERPISRPLIRA